MDTAMVKYIMGAIILIVFIVCVFLTWYFSHKAKHKEQLLMIEKGLSEQDRLNRQKPGNNSAWLKMGILVTGLGFGLLVIAILIK